MEEPRILTRDQLKEKSQQPRTAALYLPELGEGAAVRVRAFTLGDTLDVSQASTFVRPDGTVEVDQSNNMLLSLILALDEPKLSMEDAEWIRSLPGGIADRIILKAQELSGRTVDTFSQMKAALRENGYLRRIYSLCVEKLGRLPSELSEVPEFEFNTALAALELDAEDIEAEMDKVGDDS